MASSRTWWPASFTACWGTRGRSPRTGRAIWRSWTTRGTGRTHLLISHWAPYWARWSKAIWTSWAILDSGKEKTTNPWDWQSDDSCYDNPECMDYCLVDNFCHRQQDACEPSVIVAGSNVHALIHLKVQSVFKSRRHITMQSTVLRFTNHSDSWLHYIVVVVVVVTFRHINFRHMAEETQSYAYKFIMQVAQVGSKTSRPY